MAKQDTLFYGFNSVNDFILNAEQKSEIDHYYFSLTKFYETDPFDFNTPIYFESRELEKQGTFLLNRMSSNADTMFELALYYAGFPKDVFFKCSDLGMISSDPECFYDFLLFYRKGKIRDINKLKHYAIRAYEYRNITRAYWYGISINELILSAEIESESKEYTRLLKDIVEKNEKYILDEIKTLKEKLKRLELTKETPKNKKMKEKFNQIIKRKLAFYNNAKLGNTYISTDQNLFYPYVNPYVIYAYYYGIGGVKKDLSKVKEYVFLSKAYIWKLFYSGYFVPKDTELALHILKLQNTEQSKAEIQKIKSGYYDNLNNCSYPRFDKARSIEFSKL